MKGESMKKIGLVLAALLFALPVHADFLEGEEAFANKRYSEAMQHFRPLADQGDFRSQYYVAYMYINGYGVSKNDQVGLQYLQKSLDQNYDLAQAMMGFLYSEGRVVPVDRKKAVMLYQKAADQGNTSALLNLAVAYYQGDGVPRNLTKAIELLEKIPVDQKPEAGRYLGDIYLVQNADNVDKALNAYRLAAEAGDLASYASLAEIYLNGRGVATDGEKSLKYYTYAASQGYGPAQYALGIMYANGKGVSRNPVLAHAWLSWAVNQNYEPANAALNQLKAEMTLSDLDRARQEFMNIQQRVLGKIASPFEEERQVKAAMQQNQRKRRSFRRRR